jgi:hypothetical protein
MKLRFAIGFLLLPAIACGSPSATNVDAPSNDDSNVVIDAATQLDAPPVVTGRPTQAILTSRGGPVMAAPKIIMLYSVGQSANLRTKIDQVVAAIPGSTYWREITSQYGVGALTVVPAQTLPASVALPTSMADAGTYLVKITDGTHPGIPQSDGNTLYSLMLPATGFDGACTQFGGFHFDTVGANGKVIIYSMNFNCAAGNPSEVDVAGVVVSHELIEAATDPLPSTNPAYATVDDEHVAWAVQFGGENGDLCHTRRDAREPLRVAGVTVSPAWSNQSAMAGHDPCVPAPATPYFYAAADVPLVTDAMGSQRYVMLAMGQSVTIDVKLYSDAVVTAWDLSTQLVREQGGTPSLTLTFDDATGNNGDVRRLTIKRDAAGPLQGYSIFNIVSKQGNVSHVWPVIVGD